MEVYREDSRYKDWAVYKRAYVLSLEIHKVSLGFPKIETYELGNQIRRASKSILMNLAEGYAKRQSPMEFKRFVMIAIGSSEEIKVHLDYCRDLGYISTDVHTRYYNEYTEITKMLAGLHKNWK